MRLTRIAGIISVKTIKEIPVHITMYSTATRDYTRTTIDGTQYYYKRGATSSVDLTITDQSTVSFWVGGIASKFIYLNGTEVSSSTYVLDLRNVNTMDILMRRYGTGGDYYGGITITTT